MKRTNPAHVEAAMRLLEYEAGNGAGAEECAEAVGRVYEKLHTQLSPLLGSSGIQALFARSAKLTRNELALLGESVVVESATKLRAYFQAQEPDVTAATAAALFGAFFTLITGLIGERLVLEALRRVWPDVVIEKMQSAPKEKK